MKKKVLEDSEDIITRLGFSMGDGGGGPSDQGTPTPLGWVVVHFSLVTTRRSTLWSLCLDGVRGGREDHRRYGPVTGPWVFFVRVGPGPEFLESSESEKMINFKGLYVERYKVGPLKRKFSPPYEWDL